MRPLNEIEARALRHSNALAGDMTPAFHWQVYHACRRNWRGLLALGLVLLLCAAIPGAFQ